MMEPTSVGLQSDDMAAGDGNMVRNSEGAARWAVDASDPEIAVRANAFGDMIPPAQRVVYSPQEFNQVPNYVSSEQTTDMLIPERVGRGGHHREVLPEKFAGKIPWTDYYRHFSVCMTLNGWSDSEAGQYLASRLQGAALKVLNNLPANQPISFRALVSHLEKRFGPGQEAENFMLELRT